MDTDEYEQKAATMLSDDNTYEKLNKDPTTEYNKNLISIKQVERWGQEQYKYLYPVAE